MILILCIILALFIYFAVPWIYGQCARYKLKCQVRSKKVLILTFDDGPGLTLTDDICKVLADHGAKASFFLLGRNVKGLQEIVRRLAAQGHDICSHGYEHIDHWKSWPWDSVKDISRGWKVIGDAIGNSDEFAFRPPFGRLNIISLCYLLIRRVPIVYWSKDIGDTFPDPEKQMPEVNQIGSQGEVLLAHDYERKDMNCRGKLLSSLGEILPRAQSRGVRVIKFSELDCRTSDVS